MRHRRYVRTDRIASVSRRVLLRQHDRENGTASVEPLVALAALAALAWAIVLAADRIGVVSRDSPHGHDRPNVSLRAMEWILYATVR